MALEEPSGAFRVSGVGFQGSFAVTFLSYIYIYTYVISERAPRWADQGCGSLMG